jgi:hypothetical protein
LIPASGDQDHTVLSSARSIVRLTTLLASIAARLTFVTTRTSLSSRRVETDIALFLKNGRGILGATARKAYRPVLFIEIRVLARLVASRAGKCEGLERCDLTVQSHYIVINHLD